MKTIQFELLNKKFDDQYTFDLQGYLTFQDFTANMKIINRQFQKTPLPKHQTLFMIFIWLLWISTSFFIYFTFMNDLSLWIILLLSLFIILSSLFCIIYYQRRIQKFEKNLVKACEELNDKESMRGIEYQLLKNDGPCQMNYHGYFSWYFLFGVSSNYEIMIQFDDRYDLRYSKDFVCVPLYPPNPIILLDEKPNEYNDSLLFYSNDEKKHIIDSSNNV
ncbi:hypothetical protein BJ944DRAFT_241638 [Cunninghamella echinulata]|nr:hypothetical protein BJ944DRAFT_241638 [Cunninghamella echinulata]